MQEDRSFPVILSGDPVYSLDIKLRAPISAVSGCVCVNRVAGDTGYLNVVRLPGGFTWPSHSSNEKLVN